MIDITKEEREVLMDVPTIESCTCDICKRLIYRRTFMNTYNDGKISMSDLDSYFEKNPIIIDYFEIISTHNKDIHVCKSCVDKAISGIMPDNFQDEHDEMKVRSCSSVAYESEVKE